MSQNTKSGTSENSYRVYTAGGIFTQHDLTTNVYIKESIWRQSNGKFELVLPQSKEMRDLDRPDLAVYIRNADLSNVLLADIILARFDGLELDAGTVVEFMFAKFLAKPVVILRCDSRRLGEENLDEPYNLMVKNWPRTVEVHFDSLYEFSRVLSEESEKVGNVDTFQAAIKAELKTVMQGIDETAQKIIRGLEAVLEIKSPYPHEYQEIVYKVARYSPGSGFDQLIPEEDLDRLLERFRESGTL
jgi:nucleoside 2-deoxyribosyltransferase